MGTCSSCHDGVTATGKHPTHIDSGDRCEDCHSTTGWIPANFDHVNITGNCSKLSQRHRRDRQGAAAYADDQCLRRLPHTQMSGSRRYTVDHTQVIGACSSCHDGTTAVGKHPTHIDSGNNCDDCHTSVAWVPANFDHADIVDNCFSCHNGADATGKGPLHVQTTNVCEDCHSSSVWTPVTTVDHNQVLGSCSSCHNGTIATGQNPGHFSTSQDCGVCHDPNALDAG